jgi:hypothetical protein
MNHSMTWADFYLICFAVGFCLSFLSFVLGSARLGRVHMPHLHGPAGGHAPIASGHAAAGPRAAVPAQQADGLSPFNFATMTAFLAWFGGAGYLLTRYSPLRVSVELLLSTVVGLVGAGIVFLFLSRILMRAEEEMDPADYEMVGVLGRITSSIREGGTGELLYSQMGTRRVCGARSEDSTAIARGTEVVVTRYEKGIAYVRLWSEMAGEESIPAG